MFAAPAFNLVDIVTTIEFKAVYAATIRAMPVAVDGTIAEKVMDRYLLTDFKLHISMNYSVI